MKLQYLGDSKDSFKWDYLHFLAEALGCRRLRIAWMMTPDDSGSDGQTSPERFPARPPILALCQQLRASRNPALVASLPAITHAPYSVAFHDPKRFLGAGTREAYFAALRLEPRDVLFFDPDNGFEPERRFSEKHLRYVELEQVLHHAPADVVAVVFQHHRRKKFPDDFAAIRKRLRSGHAAALYWHSLMFVAVSTSPDTLARVRDAHRAYARVRPVAFLA